MKRRTKVGLAVAGLSIALSAGLAQLPSVQAEARLVALRVSLAHPTIVQAGAAFGLMGCEPPNDTPISIVPSTGKQTDGFSLAATATSTDETSLTITVDVTTSRTEFVQLAEGDELIVLEEGESPVVLASKQVSAGTRVPTAAPGSEVPVYTATIDRSTGIRRPFLAFRREGVIVTKATLPLFEIAPESVVLTTGAPVTFSIDGPLVDDDNDGTLSFSVWSADSTCPSLGSQLARRDGRQVTSPVPLGGGGSGGGGECVADLRVDAKGLRAPFEGRTGQWLTLDLTRIERDLPVEPRRRAGADDAGTRDAAIGDAGAD